MVMERSGSCDVEDRFRRIGRRTMNGVIYLVGLIVVVMAVLSFAGLR